MARKCKTIDYEQSGRQTLTINDCAIYGLRKSTVEPVIGIIKEVLGFRQFSLRGLDAAAGEWCLVCLAWNLAAAQAGNRLKDEDYSLVLRLLPETEAI